MFQSLISSKKKTLNNSKQSAGRKSSHSFSKSYLYLSLIALLSSPAISQAASVLSSFNCNSAGLTGAGSDVCTVALSGPAANGGQAVSLKSNDAAVVVPASLTVPAGKTSTAFTVPVASVTTTQTATMTATSGSVSKAFALKLTAYAPAMQLNANSLSFGSVQVKTASSRTVTLTSTGNAPLVITSAKLTGTGFTLTGATFPLTLAPGQTVTLNVQFQPASAGVVTGTLTLASNVTASAATAMAVTGTGSAPTVSAFYCASGGYTGAATDLCTVVLSSASTTAQSVALSSNVTTVVVPASVTVGANATTAQFNANVAAVGTTQFATLTASTASSSRTFQIKQTAVPAGLNLSTTSLTFAKQALNSATTQTVTLSSANTTPVTISGISTSGTGFTTSGATFPLTLNSGQSVNLTVRFDPTVAGAVSGQLTINSSALSGGKAVVALSGTGATPALSAFYCSSGGYTGAGTDTCSVVLNGSSTVAQTVTLANSNTSVTIPTSVTVPANSTTAQFTANVASSSTTQFATLSGTAGGNTMTFQIKLTAATPVLKLSTSALAFSSTAVNAATTQTLTLSSTGNAAVTINPATLSNSSFSVVGAPPASLSPGQTATVTVQFKPAAAGSVVGQMTLTGNTTASTVVLSGTGTAAKTFTYGGSTLQNTYTPPASTATVSNNLFGMTIFNLVYGTTPFPDFALSTMRLWDVTPWSSIETSNGTFNWTKMDNAIYAGQQNGAQDYVYTFGAVPAWASTNPTDPCTNGEGVGSCDAPNMAAFDAFATAMVQRYCGKVMYYETWNEANSAQYWNGTNAQLVTIAQHLYQIAKNPANCTVNGVNPNKVLLPSISRITTANLTWLQNYLAAAGAPYQYSDIVAFHGYGVTNPEDIITQVQQFQQVIAPYGLSNQQIWNTEASWGTTGAAIAQQQASWVMRYHMAQVAAGVSRFIWYAYDSCSWGSLWSNAGCSNGQTPSNAANPAGESYGVIESWMIGATLKSCQQYANGIWVCQLQRAGGYQATMLWSSTGTSIAVPIPSNSGVIQYRDWLNNVNQAPQSLTVTQMPVLLENQNITLN